MFSNKEYVINNNRGLKNMTKANTSVTSAYVDIKYVNPRVHAAIREITVCLVNLYENIKDKAIDPATKIPDKRLIR